MKERIKHREMANVLMAGAYGDIYKKCLYEILGMKDHERTPMQVYRIIDDHLKTIEFHDREEREKYRNVMIARVEPYICYGHCDGCGVRLLATDDSFCSRTCEVRYLDWR